jgi:glucose-1-phosphate cytidylyltransferase
MKVVLFCGGLGMRIRDNGQDIPKPMITIGYRPVLWHVMKYYAHYGHREFVLCLGYRADIIKHYFLNYDECLSNDFVLSAGGSKVELVNRDIHDWKITFVDTGLKSTIGERLKAVEPYVAGDEMFLANYADGLTDLHLPDLLDHFARRRAVGSFLSVRPVQSFHVVSIGEEDCVTGIQDLSRSGLWVNGGYFVFKREIFDALGEGDELVLQAFQRLIQRKELITYRHDGFWACMDTFKDRQQLEELYSRGEAPWEVWRTHDNPRERAPAAP